MFNRYQKLKHSIGKSVSIVEINENHYSEETMQDKYRTGNVEKHRDDLTGEYIYGDMIQLLFLLLFLAVWIIDSFFFHFSDISFLLPLWFRVISAAIVLGGGFIMARKGLNIVFGKPPVVPTVIDHSVFSIVRHPIYLSAILFYLGLLLFRISLTAAGVWLAVIIMYYYLSRFEEKLLIKRFGDDYLEYMKKVPMLIPRLF